MVPPDDFEAARAACLDAILASESPKQVIVAGAGTGKTFTFKQLLRKVAGNCLAITFLNALANDMAEELGDLADTRTFHSFCRLLLHGIPSDGITTDFHFFPKLERLVTVDNGAFGFAEAGAHFGKAFRSLVEDDGRVAFFLNRASFYNAVGFDDSVYRVLQHFRQNPDQIPAFDQVVVDEYQDFNPLEVEFIDRLESKSPIMIVGDDDQAIYDFKAASPEYLRQKATSTEFERHDLPFCSRCTAVVVDATNSVIESAAESGLLQGRIKKEYRCYLPDKTADSERYPKLVRVSCSVHTRRAPYVARYIEQIIASAPGQEVKESITGRYPLALIIGPSHYLRQLNSYLSERFEGVVYKQRTPGDLTLLDGYRVLLKDEHSNLGWRIVTWLSNPHRSNELTVIADSKGTTLWDQLEAEDRDEQVALLASLRALISGEYIGEDAIVAIEERLGMSRDELAAELGIDEDEDVEAAEESNRTAETHPEIWLTTYNGCKGMSAGFTFIVGLENGLLPRDPEHMTDSEVCQFLVALTRTRKQCHLISTGRFGGVASRPSAFLGWVPTESVSRIRVDKRYFG